MKPDNTPTTDLTPIQFGHDLMQGALYCLAKWILFVYFVVMLFNLARNWLGWGLDDSDRDSWHRSGLQLHHDAKFGVEYLSDGKGGLTRRIYSKPEQETP